MYRLPPRPPPFPYTPLFRSTSRTLARDDGSWRRAPSRIVVGRGDVEILAQQVVGGETFVDAHGFAKQPRAAGPEIGRAHVCTPVTVKTRMPFAAWQKKMDDP